MILKKKLSSICVMIIITILACKGQNTDVITNETEKSVTQFNNDAMRIFQKNVLSQRIDMDSLKLSIAYLDSAIVIDSSYLLSYSNKAQILIIINELDQAINCLNKINNLNTGNCIGTNQLIGFIYLQKGDLETSRREFKKAIECQEKLLQTNPELTVSIKSNLAFLKMLVINKEAAISAINKVIEENESNSQIQIAINMKNAIVTYNQEDYLNDMFPTSNSKVSK